MKQKSGQKFHVPDLKSKVRTLETVFGEKYMRSGLNPRTVDKWLRDPDPAPYLTSLKRYFGVIGMIESDMLSSQAEFSKKVAEIHSQFKPAEKGCYSPQNVITIYESFAGENERETALLGATLKMIQKETIQNDFAYLKGYYHMYHYWKSGDANDTDKIRRNLIELYDLDMKHGLMNCRIMVSPMKNLSREDWWEYEGWIFSIKNKLFWLFECIKGMPPEIVTLHIFKPPFWPESDRFILHGILTALSLEGTPCASSTALIKIKADDARKNKIGYFSPAEIRSEGHHIDPLNYIDNSIKITKTI